MAFTHGKKQAFLLDNSAGALQNLSTYFDEISFPRTVETAEVTTFGKTAKVYIVGLEDATISGSGKFDPTVDAHIVGVIAAHKAGTLLTATFEYGPEGNASGKVKFTGECIVTSYEVSGSVGDAVTFSFEAQVSDDVTRTTFA